jgi:hypothetical protein
VKLAGAIAGIPHAPSDETLGITLIETLDRPTTAGFTGPLVGQVKEQDE